MALIYWEKGDRTIINKRQNCPASHLHSNDIDISASNSSCSSLHSPESCQKDAKKLSKNQKFHQWQEYSLWSFTLFAWWLCGLFVVQLNVCLIYKNYVSFNLEYNKHYYIQQASVEGHRSILVGSFLLGFCYTDHFHGNRHELCICFVFLQSFP